ncbi:MAG: hypothetical protein ACM3SQ_00525 [Betaproteobacteria bacterium]
MRTRVLVGVFLLVASLGAGTLATSGDGVAPLKQWALVNFVEPTRVGSDILSGTYLIVHDDIKMERGEPCTTIYRWDPVRGPREAVVSFRCHPALRNVAGRLTLTVRRLRDLGSGCRLIEYQFAGDAEAHGVPLQ